MKSKFLFIVFFLLTGVFIFLVVGENRREREGKKNMEQVIDIASDDFLDGTEEMKITKEMVVSDVKIIYQGSILKNREWLAKNCFLIVTRCTKKSEIDFLKKINPDLKIVQYVNSKLVHDDYVLDYPYYDVAQKEDLFWKTKEGELIEHKSYDTYLMAISNPKWRSAVVSVLGSSDELFGNENYDGVMFDDAMVLWEGSFSGIPGNYSRQIELEGIHALFEEYKIQFPNKTIVFNGYSHPKKDDRWESGVDFLDVADVISFETFLVKFNGRPYEKSRIHRHIRDYHYVTTKLNKQAIFIDFANTEDNNRRVLSLGTFLLLKNKNSLYAILSGSGELEIYPEYYVDIGKPMADFIRDGDLYSRRFERGTVYVNFGDDKQVVYSENSRELELIGGGSMDDMGSIVWKKVEPNIVVVPNSAVIIGH